MKIIHVISYFQPKLGYQEFYLAKEHQKLGHEVHIITSDRYAPGLYPAAKKLLGPRIKSSGYFIEDGIKTWRLPTLFEMQGNVWIMGLRKKLLELNPDVIICHGILSTLSIRVALLKKFLPNSKFIFDCHMVFCAKRNWANPLYHLFKFTFGRTITKIADSLIATQLESVKFMNDIYGIPPERIKLIPLGCDTKLFYRSQETRRKTRAHYNISNNDVAFVYAGKITPKKGVHILVESAINAMREYSNIKVLLIGSGEPKYIKMIKKKINRSGFQDNFIFVHMVPHKELYKYYSSGDVGVWPKQCSLTMVEAMACGLPVIIANDSGTPDRVSYKNGLIYRSGDVEDLEEKMKRMFDGKTRRKMQRNATEYAQKLDWAIISREFLGTVS
ncbi:MAG: glycosyltransferase family 4 protein [archaeon]